MESKFLQDKEVETIQTLPKLLVFIPDYLFLIPAAKGSILFVFLSASLIESGKTSSTFIVQLAIMYFIFIAS